jgi:hypothetical protein
MRGLLVSLGVGIMSVMFTIGLSLNSSHGAQPLTDNELDAITAAGSFSIDIIPPSAPAPLAAAAPPIAIGVQSASAAIQAASAALEASSTLNNHQGVPIAIKAVEAASAAVDTISSHNGVIAVNAASAAIQAASSAIGELNQDPAMANPSILAASKGLETANNNLIQSSLQNGAPAISAASAALKAASAALEAVPTQNGLEAHTSAPAIIAAADAVKAASSAINLASTLTGTTAQPSQGGIALNPTAEFGDLIDPASLSDTPGVRFSFDAGGGTTGSGSAQIPPSGPSLNANNPNLTFSGNPLLSGNAFQVQNMLLNMNICVKCQASGHIVQTGNGFVFPITIQ